MTHRDISSIPDNAQNVHKIEYYLEDRYGEPECQFEFYRNWVNNPQETQKKVEALTRSLPGVKWAPISGIPYKEQIDSAHYSNSIKERE